MIANALLANIVMAIIMQRIIKSILYTYNYHLYHKTWISKPDYSADIFI